MANLLRFTSLLILAATLRLTETTTITWVSPRYGSINGATKITIYGQGFASNQFNFGPGNEDLGNQVKLVSHTQAFECDILRDETIASRVVCYTRAMPADQYEVRVHVDGNLVPVENICNGNPASWSCTFYPHNSYTPTITSISPVSALPGTLLTIHGKMFTDLFGTNLVEATNGAEVRIKRVYVGGQLCDLVDSDAPDRPDVADELYGLELDGDNSQTGYMICKPGGTYVGNMNVSFIIDGSYGRSSPNADLYWVSATNTIAMFQTYAEITGVHPSTGSIAGGTLLTISGNYFDETDYPAEVTIAGVPCNVVSLTQDEIICETPPDSSNVNNSYPGNRGMLVEIWDGTYDRPAAEVLTLTNPTSTQYLHSLSWPDQSKDQYTARMRGYFVPPSDNDYRFLVKGDDDVFLWFSMTSHPGDKELIAYCDNYCLNYDSDGTQISDRMTLIGGQYYYMEIAFSDGSSADWFYVSAMMYETPLSYGQAHNIQLEQQTISTISTVTPEIQRIQFTNWPNTSEPTVYEVQEMTISSDYLDYLSFRLGMYGVFTEPFSVMSASQMIQLGLSELMSIAPDSVTVSTSITSTEMLITVTFISDRGDWPDLQGMVDDSTPMQANFTVNETVKGVASMETFTLSLEGTPSAPIRINSTASQVADAVFNMVKVRCPTAVTSPPGAKFYEGYETATGYYESGTRTNDIPPFCGRSSLHNPTYIFREGNGAPYVNIMSYGYLCFAHKGPLDDKLKITYDYKECSSCDQLTAYDVFNGVGITNNEDGSWGYTCIDTRALVQNERVSATWTKLIKYDVYKSDGATDIWVDDIFIGAAMPSTDLTGIAKYRRMVPSTWAIGATSAVGDVETGFNVTMTVNNCASNISLLQVEHAPGVAVDEDTSTYSGGSWAPGANVTVMRILAASPPISGTFDLTFNGYPVTGISSTASASEMRSQLETVPEIGSLQVEKTGTCSMATWTVSWLTAPGDQPQIQVGNTTNLIGLDAAVTTATISDAGVFLEPIPIQMIRSYEETPQVSVLINKISSRCTGNCSFLWSNESTPTITAVSPTSGSSRYNTVLVIDGSGFDPSPDNNTVMIGGEVCDVTSATESQLQCEVGPGPAGTYDVIVYVNDKGLPLTNGSIFTFTYFFELDTLTPNNGSIAGGTILTATGTGFSEMINVTVGDHECDIITANYSVIECFTPPQASAGVYTVLLLQDNTVADGGGITFTTDEDLTPIVNSTSTSTGLVMGGTVMTIIGSGFGTSEATEYSAVSLDGIAAEVTTYGDSAIQAILPALRPGSYPLKVYVDGMGFADTRSYGIPEVVYELEVRAVFPSNGSQVGGTRLTITGAGFTNASISDVDVLIGDDSCVMEEVNDASIICITSSRQQTHHIDNSGTHPDYGIGYAWKPAARSIYVGDSVHWSWQANPLVSGVGYLVQQTATAFSEQYDGSGFTSGDIKTETGSYTYMFTQPGIYYYWSGAVDNAGQIYMRGAIYVEERPSQELPISVYVNSFEAHYNLTDDAVSANSGYNGTMSFIEGCNDEETTSNATDTHPSFIFSKCHTPVIEYIEPTIGPSTQFINFHGVGFSSELSDNDIMIGGYSCDVMMANDTHMTCLLDSNDGIEIGTFLLVDVNINNLGNALNVEPVMTNRYFILLPHVANVSPAQGSVGGGTELTITGSGFSGVVTVAIASYQCMVTYNDYNNITCITSSAFEVNSTVSVNVYKDGQAIPAECTGDCQFQYLDALTPTVTNLSVSTIDHLDTNLTVSGTLFGDEPNNVYVSIGNTECAIQNISETEITCLSGAPLAGSQSLTLTIQPRGLATFDGVSNEINVIPQLDAITPASGSLGGGTLISISGLGFDVSSTSVTVGGSTCVTISVTTVEVQCYTPSGSEGQAEVIVTSSGETFPSGSYMYAASATPTVTAISPVTGNPGDSITLTGSNLGTDSNALMVSLGDSTCNVSSVSDTSVTCIVGEHPAGEVALTGMVDALGFISSDVTFTFALTLDSISPTSGSLAGGQNLTVDGHGFDDVTTDVTICGQPCYFVDVISSTQLICISPSNSGSGTVSCDVIISVGDSQDTLAGAYTYEASLTPEITGVSPTRGGTGGGVTITILGSGFGSDAGVIMVTIAGTECVLASVSDTQIECVTGEHRPSVKTQVLVEVDGNGIAEQVNADFEYIDVWSSVFTWGESGRIPEEGDLVVIPSDMTVLLDVDTPILTMLLIQGGTLIFDEADITLQATYILIAEGGHFQVGTEDAPFEHQATILLHGHALTDELPIYGAKVLAVREGTLDLHGKPTNMVWTQLGQTAAAGDTQIILEVPVDWTVGSLIGIATTGGPESQAQNELRYITAVSGDGFTLTLDEPLNYEHLGETVDLGQGYTLEARAEVGLLSRNVVVRGYDNPQWNDHIPACDAGFDTGEFAVQTCFQGRFGEEIGADMIGAHIIMHPSVPGVNHIMGRFSYMEITYAGQAYRLGRYAIHFHLGGDMTGSYVRGVAIHRSFNRAVVVHGTHNILVEDTVIYDIMGGAFFLEDGVEMGNVFERNLAIFVKASSSLQNDDITPAAFWATNPNNTFRHNHVAGGTHFGFWYRMHEHPDGSSFTSSYCPRNVPMGNFYNNTVHSVGWFGIWIFQVWHPMQGGGCDSTTPEPAKFFELTAWNCEKGAEWVIGGAIQFIDFFLVNNQVAGIEAKTIAGADLYSEEHGAMIKDSVIIARPDNIGDLSVQNTDSGIILPFAFGLIVEGVTFVNFDQGAAFGTTTIAGTSGPDNGGFMVQTRGLDFLNSPNRVGFRWVHEQVLHDLDGTLGGIVGGKVLPYSDILPAEKCTTESTLSAGVSGAVCDNTTEFIRWAFSGASPDSLLGKAVMMTNDHGSVTGSYQMKRITHKPGWMLLLLTGETYMFEFINAQHITNISYSGRMYGFGEEDYIIMQHNMTQSVDRFKIQPGPLNEWDDDMQTTLTYEDSSNGDWTWDNKTRIVSYIISGKTDVSRRSTGNSGRTDRSVDFEVYQCYYLDCFVPYVPGPGDSDLVETPENAVFWDVRSSWEGTEEGWGGNYGDGDYGPPLTGDDVKIPTGVWMVIRGPLPELKKLYIYGTLEFQSTPDADGNYLNITLSCTHILIMGGHLIVGREGSPFLGNADIILRGTWFSEELIMLDGPVVGAKAIGVFGGLDLHGRPQNVTWTQLALAAAVGDTEITVETSVDWEAGDEIIIVTTSYSAHEGEIFTITSISEDRLTISLNGSLSYSHIVTSEDIGNGRSVKMAAEVGLLSRNVRVLGGDNPYIYEQAFGARVIVGVLATEDGDISGFARLENVEFDLTGQEGFVDYYDPRYSLAFLDVGDASSSYVHSCAFHDGFAPAVGVFATQYLNISNNVIHHTVGSGIVVTGADAVISDNLVTEVLWSGSFNGRSETWNLEWPSGIDVSMASRPVLIGNTVAGSERAAFRTTGEPCFNTVNPVEYWYGNVAHSTLSGLLYLPGDPVRSSCVLYSNFTVYKAYDWGFYYQNEASLEVSNIISIDNGVGLFPMVIKPPSISHRFAHKYVRIRDSSFIGTSSIYDCDNDVLSGVNIALSSQARSWSSPGNGKTGLVFGTFSSSSNNAPFKPFANIMSYNALYGITIVEDVTFLKFTSFCDSRHDVAIAPNPKNDDLVHPMTTKGLTFIDVDEDKKVYLHRPRLSKINPADCVDMDCDGLKKCIIQDEDGTLLGASGATLLPESEWEWNGDPRRGLGDYRIPVSLLTTPDGDRIDVDTFAPNKGIIRDNSCSFKTAWNGWVCEDLDYKMLLLESLDSDTETRRVSPIALQADGYIDLVNGPQDHGWCAGYTCQKRLSTFAFIIATGKTFDLHFTGTTPQSLKFHLMNSEADQAVGLSIFYHLPQRLDVYYQGSYVPPTNAYYNSQGEQLLQAPSHQDEYKPDVAADPAGSNYFENDYNELYILIRGPEPVIIMTSPLIIISFDMPAMTVDDFYGENLVNNLALFLGIPSENIMIANAVSASRRRRRGLSDELLTSSSRVKRDADTVEITLEISNPVANATSNSSSSNATTFTNAEMGQLSTQIVNAVQLNTLGAALNVTILGVSITEPAPSSDDESWQTVVADLDAGVDYTISLQVPASLEMLEQDGDGNYQASEASDIQPVPIFYMLDMDGEFVTQVGSSSSPWEVEATLRMLAGSDPDAYLMGTTSIDFRLGWANFTDFQISHAGVYAIDFAISSPSEAVGLFGNFSISEVTITDKMLEGRVASQASLATVDEEFSMIVEIIDMETGTQLEDIAWQGHDWSVSASLYPADMYTGSTLSGDVSVVMNETTGYGYLNMSIDQPSRYLLLFTFQSTPPDYNFTVLSSYIDIQRADYVEPTVETSKTIVLRFDANYNDVIDGMEDVFEMHIYNVMAALHTDVTFTDIDVTEGSILVTFTLEGAENDVTATLDDVYNSIQNGSFSVDFNGYTLETDGTMMVDGLYYSTNNVLEASDGLSTSLLIGLIAACLVVLLTIVVVIVYNHSKKGQKKTFEVDEILGRRFERSPTPISPRMDIVIIDDEAPVSDDETCEKNPPSPELKVQPPSDRDLVTPEPSPAEQRVRTPTLLGAWTDRPHPSPTPSAGPSLRSGRISPCPSSARSHTESPLLKPGGAPIPRNSPVPTPNKSAASTDTTLEIPALRIDCLDDDDDVTSTGSAGGALCAQHAVRP